MASLPISQTRPKRASAAATADAIGRSLKEQDAAPDERATKKSRAEDDEDVDVQTPAKRQSKLKAAKMPSSKAALKAAPPADVAAIKPAEYAARQLEHPVKKKLNAHVKTLARMVNSDWHDGYEEQGEECLEWVASCGVLVESALRVGVAFGCGHELGHAVLMHVADTWSQIEKIPFRCDPGECISDGAWQDGSKIFLVLSEEDDGTEYTCHSADALCSLAWPLLLGAAAASPAVGDEALLRMVKDAVDHGVCAPHKASEEEVELASDGMRLPTSMATGRERLAALVVGRKAEWSALPSTKKEHKQRRAIDRRFDGPKNQRTRDFSSSFYDDFW